MKREKEREYRIRLDRDGYMKKKRSEREYIEKKGAILEAKKKKITEEKKN